MFVQSAPYSAIPFSSGTCMNTACPHVAPGPNDSSWIMDTDIGMQRLPGAGGFPAAAGQPDANGCGVWTICLLALATGAAMHETASTQSSAWSHSRAPRGAN